MPIWTTDIQDKPFSRKLWFGYLDVRSGLVGFRGLGCDCRVRGVSNSAEGTQKNLEVYSVNEISKTLNDKGITGKLEKEILNSLRQ